MQSLATKDGQCSTRDDDMITPPKDSILLFHLNHSTSEGTCRLMFYNNVISIDDVLHYYVKFVQLRCLLQTTVLRMSV